MKSEKGVTLVALVIAIVVLLILAAVAIFMVMDGVYTGPDSNKESNNTIVETTENVIEEKVENSQTVAE